MLSVHRQRRRRAIQPELKSKPPSTMGAGSGKNKVRRKKRISKHVQDAEERRKNNKVAGGEGESAQEQQQQDQEQKEASSAKKKNKGANRHVKDPAEAAAYLSSWKHREAGSGWRFNKNTQSWLLRHMYETDKCPKATFTLLVEYLVGCQGTTRRRLREDAARRALRYKEYEKKNDSGEKAADDGNDGDDAEEAKDKKKEISDDATDEARWNSLNDHDKRKEYKRARKILDTIKEEVQE